MSGPRGARAGGQSSTRGSAIATRSARWCPTRRRWRRSRRRRRKRRRCEVFRRCVRATPTLRSLIASARARELRRSRSTPMVVTSSRLGVATIVGLSFLLVGCGDTTGPGTPIDVTVSLLSRDGPNLSVGPDSAPRIACSVDVRATATGSGRATWGDATLRLFAGKDRSTPIDTFVVPTARVQSAWGKPDIGPGESEESGAQFAANIPFGGEIRYRYSPSGSGTKTAVFTFDCGPAPTVTTFPPVITALSLEPPTGPVQPGDILKLDYRATSRVGLWETTIALSGPCTARWILPEGLQQSVTRVVSVAIPFACRLGVPLRLSATAVDAAAQAVSGSVEPGIALVDMTPPTVEPM